MEDRVSVDITGGVAHVRMVRGDKMNALDDAMFEALRETGKELSQTTGVRAVVLSGEGRAFCAGLDMGNFAGMANADGPAELGGVPTLSERTHGIANGPQAAAWVWRELPVPVIAAVHGVAYGGGFQVCLGADLRYAAPDTRFSVMEIKWGLVPDVAGTRLMKDLARDDVIRELTYTGRIFSAEEALAYGFVTRVVDDPLALALETATEIASKNPDAQRANKRLLNAAHQLTDAEGLLMESREQDAIIGTPNQVEAVMAELEKRPANFTD
jgi:enoyl-CoA hydratase/carnithine racemase